MLKPTNTIPNKYICSITQDIMRDPVTTADGHNYDREAIERWLISNDTSPKTGLRLRHKYLADNWELKNRIKEWLMENPQGAQAILLAAVKENKLDIVNDQLFLGVDINLQDADGYTFLHHATALNFISIVKKLLEVGADTTKKTTIVDHAGFSQKTSLHIAADKNHTDIMTLLIKFHSDLEGINSNNETPLASAARCGSVEACGMLIAAGAGTEGNSLCNATPLSNAAYNGHNGVLKMLIQKGANIENTGTNKLSPLISAILKDQVDTVKLLLELGANVNAISKKKHWTALHYAVEHGAKECLNVLINAKANLNAKTENLETALHLAVLTKHTEIAEILVDNDANIHVEDTTGNSPLHLAAKEGNVLLVKIFILNGANPKVQNNDRKSPQQLAEEAGFKELATKIDQWQKEFKYSIRELPKAFLLVNQRLAQLEAMLDIKIEPQKNEVLASEFRLFQ